MRGGGKKIGMLPLFFGVLAVVLVVVHIVRRDENSWVARAVGWIGERVEGFDARVRTATACPAGMRPFNNEKGASFCCGATVNPYGATCSDPKKTCALEPNADAPLCKP